MHSFFLCQTSIGQNILPPLPVICGEGAMSLIMVFYGRLSRYHLMRAAIGVAHDDGTALFACYTSAVQIIVAYYAGCFSSCGHKVKLRWWRFFFGRSCPRHRVHHNGSSCQFIGKPMAVTSTEGYVARRLFNLVLNASPLPIESDQYAIQHVMAYSLLPSMPVAFIQEPLMVAPI